MAAHKKELLETLEKIQGLPVLVVGDLILDQYIWGGVTRISPEAPVPVVEVKKTEYRLGGAANAARNLRSLNAKVTMCGFIGDDDEGKEVLSLLNADGISAGGVVVDKKRPTSIKTRVIAQHQQIVRIDREDKSPKELGLREAFASLVDAEVEKARGIIISDYGKGAIFQALIKRFDAARGEGRISLKSKPLVVDPHPTNYAIYGGMSVAKPNRKEAEAAAGMRITDKESAIEAASILLSLWKADVMVITLGEDGLVMAFADGRKPVLLETRARQVFDVSGAGDTVTALFTAGISAGASPEVAGELANIGAGIVVSEVGTVAIDAKKLKAEIEALPS